MIQSFPCRYFWCVLLNTYQLRVTSSAEGYDKSRLILSLHWPVFRQTFPTTAVCTRAVRHKYELWRDCLGLLGYFRCYGKIWFTSLSLVFRLFNSWKCCYQTDTGFRVCVSCWLGLGDSIMLTDCSRCYKTGFIRTYKAFLIPTMITLITKTKAAKKCTGGARGLYPFPGISSTNFQRRRAYERATYIRIPHWQMMLWCSSRYFIYNIHIFWSMLSDVLKSVNLNLKKATLKMLRP